MTQRNYLKWATLFREIPTVDTGLIDFEADQSRPPYDMVQRCSQTPYRRCLNTNSEFQEVALSEMKRRKCSDEMRLEKFVNQLQQHIKNLENKVELSKVNVVSALTPADS